MPFAGQSFLLLVGVAVIFLLAGLLERVSRAELTCEVYQGFIHAGGARNDQQNCRWTE